MLVDDYRGPFDPDLALSGLSRQALAHLGREYLLNGHLQDRVGLPQGGDSPAVLWLDLDAENFDEDDPVTSNLKKINLPSAGVLRKKVTMASRTSMAIARVIMFL